ncbi:hypothetical protein MINTM020_47540 [Mycobacterium paraintracellulare]|uniref:hypothetical protein n=1 Tax=Mycobacterium avium complex (MAC) TaxID=120793 RepID=UPI0019265B50|nr:hypothetical protein [Mycobacterium paraintracellulare]BCO43899.1 hypothetical protein MINTM001_50380 [Mycobacterium paraintracellulare]BCP12656.1 hypothetical protein MINTM020_47540 [Mycobacterium paraintracellulare]
MRPLVKRTPDGRPYAVPSAPRHPLPPLRPQPAEHVEGGPEPTPARVDRRPKLTAEDVRAIRADYAAGKWSQGDLAYIYGVTQSTISAALSGDTHVTTGPTARQEN